MTTTFIAPDIECGGCAASIKTALEREPGIRQVQVSVPEKMVTVDFDNTTICGARIAGILDDIGFPTEPAPA